MLIALLVGALTPAAHPWAQPASPDEYPTVTALEQAETPQRDRLRLGRELLGIGEIAPPPTVPVTYQVGERRSFRALNTTANRIFQFEAALMAIGESVYIWVDTRFEIDPRTAQGLADAFDRNIYPTVRDLWGTEPNPGIDSDPRVFAMFTTGLGGGIAAYYSSSNTYPDEIAPDSNEHEMFLYELNAVGQDLDSWMVQSTTAHEFQHMVRANVTPNQDSWLNEGLSVFTQLYMGYPDGAWSATEYQDNPHTQLNSWGEGNIGAHYGNASMYVTYFYERYGLKALQEVSMDNGIALDAFDRVLTERGEPGVNVFFADWVLANWWRDTSLADGRYGYALMPDLNAPYRRAFDEYPAVRQETGLQYSAAYYVLRDLPDTGTLSLKLTAPDTVSLIPTTAASGDWMWYSNRRDDSTTTLTRSFDLSDVDSATLNYQVWYETEEWWDYGYVMVSTDVGATWTLLETPIMTDQNPHGTGYGVAYSGESGGWVSESIPLDAYAGQEIMLRFAMITDDASNLSGMALDDLAIPEIGYSSDFEAEDGGWLAAGWIHMDNVLPQQLWVQLAQRSAAEFRVDRWLYPDTPVMDADLLAGAEEVVLAISPFAPVTTVPVDYTIAVNVNPTLR